MVSFRFPKKAASACGSNPKPGTIPPPFMQSPKVSQEQFMKTPALFDLTGRVAIVTGGNGGIRPGIALGFAEAGAAVAIFGRNEEKNRSVLAELKAIGVPSIAVKVDLTDRTALEPAFNQVE